MRIFHLERVRLSLSRAQNVAAGIPIYSFFLKKKTITSLNFALINFPEFIRYNYQSAGQMIKRRVHALIQSLSYHMTRLALFY